MSDSETIYGDSEDDNEFDVNEELHKKRKRKECVSSQEEEAYSKVQGGKRKLYLGSSQAGMFPCFLLCQKPELTFVSQPVLAWIYEDYL